MLTRPKLIDPFQVVRIRRPCRSLRCGTVNSLPGNELLQPRPTFVGRARVPGLGLRPERARPRACVWRRWRPQTFGRCSGECEIRAAKPQETLVFLIESGGKSPRSVVRSRSCPGGQTDPRWALIGSPPPLSACWRSRRRAAPGGRPASPGCAPRTPTSPPRRAQRCSSSTRSMPGSTRAALATRSCSRLARRRLERERASTDRSSPRAARQPALARPRRPAAALPLRLRLRDELARCRDGLDVGLTGGDPTRRRQRGGGSERERRRAAALARRVGSTQLSRNSSASGNASWPRRPRSLTATVTVLGQAQAQRTAYLAGLQARSITDQGEITRLTAEAQAAEQRSLRARPRARPGDGPAHAAGASSSRREPLAGDARRPRPLQLSLRRPARSPSSRPATTSAARPRPGFPSATASPPSTRA